MSTSPNVAAALDTKRREERIITFLEMGYWPVCTVDKSSTIVVSWGIPCVHGPNIPASSAIKAPMLWVPVWAMWILRIVDAGKQGERAPSLLMSWASMSPEYKLATVEAKKRFDELKDSPEQRLILLTNLKLSAKNEGFQADFVKAIDSAIRIDRSLRAGKR